MKSALTHQKASYLGAATAFVVFLVTGLVPALVYGGYMGLMLSSLLYGHGTADHWAARVITGGGMVVGCAATLVLYLVVGAFVGNVIGAIVGRKVAVSDASAGAAPPTQPAPRG